MIVFGVWRGLAIKRGGDGHSSPDCAFLAFYERL